MPKKLTVQINDNLDKKFRETVFKKKGMHKGNIQEAIEEALELWTTTNSDKEKKQ